MLSPPTNETKWASASVSISRNMKEERRFGSVGRGCLPPWRVKARVGVEDADGVDDFDQTPVLTIFWCLAFSSRELWAEHHLTTLIFLSFLSYSHGPIRLHWFFSVPISADEADSSKKGDRQYSKRKEDSCLYSSHGIQNCFLSNQRYREDSRQQEARLASQNRGT